MKQIINLGAYGWRQMHWSGVFYPQDLPVTGDDDWRLAYYSNEFNAVLVPADYWLDKEGADCEAWLDSVHVDFKFFVQCRADMLENLPLVDLTAALKKLSPQLSALVFLDETPSMPESVKKLFIELAEGLQLDVFDLAAGTADFILLEDDLSDLRASRAAVEQFVVKTAGNASSEATIIVHHAQLQAGNLRKFRSMLEIMGY